MTCMSDNRNHDNQHISMDELGICEDLICDCGDSLLLNQNYPYYLVGILLTHVFIFNLLGLRLFELPNN